VALEAVAVYAPLWRAAPCDSCQPVPALGGVPADDYRETLKVAVRARIARPLSRRDIVLDEAALARLLSPET
jgi:hypothetical protein